MNPSLLRFRDLPRGTDLSERLHGPLLGLLLVLLAWQAARLAWLILVPPAPIGEPAAQAIASSARLASAQSLFAAAAMPASTQSGITLFGVRLSPPPASAILQVEGGPQVSLGLGETLENGWRLAEVAGDHVVLEDATGQRRRLDLAPMPIEPSASPAAATTLPSASPTPSATPSISPEALVQQAGLVPATRDGRITGYTLVPRGDAAVLRQAGLQPGDVLTAVNGNPLDAERITELQEELARSGEATLTVERDGQPQTLKIRTTPL